MQKREKNKKQTENYKTTTVAGVIVRARKIVIAFKMQTPDLFGSGTLSMYLFEIANHFE